ncbi:MOSC and FAD-binding oxidoreductase domain-containing protein [Kitasatospora nipponensis]|uniref:MOSC and FAD-binding oxidoreductase domain-containing protein n=1 Tax=Kitasatospora nipponensis TaxID=258049 RepID=A0ABP4GIC5_9ACTN
MARLVSLNVGLPRDVSWRGRTVRTGIWKHPVTGSRMVRRLNVDGDGQGDLAGHGGEHRAVMVYQTQSYRYWEQVLGRTDFTPGQFGENFTVDGLPDDEVCVGDRYRIGRAVFEVSAPRVTCYRVGLRMDEPAMPALLVSHRRPGFYLRVLTEGEVAAGEEVVKIASGPAGVTVAEVDALLYLPGHPRSAITRALGAPALSPGWRASFQALLDQGSPEPGTSAGNAGLSPPAGPPPAWRGFRPLRVTRVRRESPSVLSLWLADAGAAPLPARLPGQFVTLRLPVQPGRPPLTRSYSLSGAPDAPEYRISVKREPQGTASRWLHAHATVGDSIQVAAPHGTFTLADGHGPVVLLSAGVGVTPVLAMLRALADARSARQVWWLHGARNGEDHVFAEESRRLLSRLPNSHARICYSRARPADRPGIDYTDPGRISADLLGRLDLPARADAYLCGPAGFLRELTDVLVTRGLRADRIHSETFGATAALTPGISTGATPPPHLPPGPVGTGPAVSFARSGVTAAWSPRYTSLLELAEACDVPVRWSCRTGVCHTCESALLAGAVRHSPEPLDPPAEGNALICCAGPEQDVTLDL